MRLTREEFVDQFWPGVKVHALKAWRLRSREPSTIVARFMYDTMCVSGAEFPIDPRAFSQILEPVICELHKIVPRNQRPTAQDLLDRAYDALSAAGVEVEIRVSYYR